MAVNAMNVPKPTAYIQNAQLDFFVKIYAAARAKRYALSQGVRAAATALY